MSEHICHTLNIWFVEALVSKLCNRESLPITFSLKQRIFTALKVCCLLIAPNKCKGDSFGSFWMVKTATGPVFKAASFPGGEEGAMKRKWVGGWCHGLHKGKERIFWVLFLLERLMGMVEIWWVGRRLQEWNNYMSWGELRPDPLVWKG